MAGAAASPTVHGVAMNGLALPALAMPALATPALGTAPDPDRLGEWIAARLAGFSGFLRSNGFATACGEAVDLLEVSLRVGLFDRAVLQASLKSLLCARADEWRRFDKLFDAWFLPANRWRSPERRDSLGRAPAGESAGATDQRAGRDDPRPRREASREEALGSADFRTLTEREHAIAIEALMRRFARRLKRVALRREARSAQRRTLDFQSTIRASVERGGLPLELRWKNRRRVKPRLVMLIDTSRSMALYAFFYLRLARALAAEWADLHSFIFHTRLTPVSQALHDPDPWRAAERLHLIAQGFAGGTRIGDSLAEFERELGSRIVHRRTAVLVMSDGYDTGEPQVLAAALARLRRRARRLVWLNPLCSRPGFAPVSQGMRAALPHLDALLPAADLASLEAVLPDLIEALH